VNWIADRAKLPQLNVQLGQWIAIGIALLALTYNVWTAADHRNAQLVEMGVAILRADPGARTWANEVIQDNSGRNFSEEAKKQLLEKPLKTASFWGSVSRGRLIQRCLKRPKKQSSMRLRQPRAQAPIPNSPMPSRQKNKGR
jgi:hypothetical protein